ncbi:putative Diguanylate kinase, GGDEF domain [Paraburkholderia piptadeniae]|uniref:diguanylate cyclase n=1 Tax=Paraburkholderia piptadeniae TaxID=1701573 RepID=A0A1N7S1E2_9BURK|nr:GGDEF domain-containing protein [Paraburkholderia piptadeniae]SIT41192.1 putative Diguanylate kinase, GGDEF domain [Paraburkholderia piptadeniae]
MSDILIVHTPASGIGVVTRAYARLLIAGFALLPAGAIAYLAGVQAPSLTFENHAFHEVAIAAATAEGAFVTYVTWRCYRSSGEPLLRWLTLGFLGFVLIYTLHGAFTGLAHHHMWLFLLYGPASRLAMAVLLLVGLLSFGRQPDEAGTRTNIRLWGTWIAAFVLIDAFVAAVASTTIASVGLIRSLESAALLFSALNVTALMVRRIRSPLMVTFGISVTWFALSSLAFLLGRPWNHMWWLAHLIFAGGFFLLSYAVVQAFHTTRSFATVYSQEVMIARLAAASIRTERALEELQRTNQKLEHLAATDPLTGAVNRRYFIVRVEEEIARAKRDGTPFSLLALDLDNFKAINDSYGHQAGDVVLQSFVQKCVEVIGPYEGVARMGGEEFMILLPQTRLDVASTIAGLIRATIAGRQFEAAPGEQIALTVSIGVAQFGPDGDSIDMIFRTADQRLYCAKGEGRNRVVAA